MPSSETNLKLLRLNDNGDSTIGILFKDNNFECYTLEDEFRELKKSGETRIPQGRYEIKERKVLSGMTKKYRSRFDWFNWHLELQDVPNFKYVYIHAGNTDDHSDGCLLCGDSQTTNRKMNNGFIGKSTDAYKSLYLSVVRDIATGKRVFVDVVDEGWING